MATKKVRGKLEYIGNSTKKNEADDSAKSVGGYVTERKVGTVTRYFVFVRK